MTLICLGYFLVNLLKHLLVTSHCKHGRMVLAMLDHKFKTCMHGMMVKIFDASHAFLSLWVTQVVLTALYQERRFHLIFGERNDNSMMHSWVEKRWKYKHWTKLLDWHSLSSFLGYMYSLQHCYILLYIICMDLVMHAYACLQLNQLRRTTNDLR